MNGLPALLITPTESAVCPDHPDVPARRYPGEETTTFAHCSECGSTSLLDTRHDFTVLSDARWLASDPMVAPEIRMGRQDDAARILSLVWEARKARRAS